MQIEFMEMKYDKFMSYKIYKFHKFIYYNFCFRISNSYLFYKCKTRIFT